MSLYDHYKLGARIKAAMKASGHQNAKEFAEKYNIPYPSLMQYLQGRREPNDEILMKLSKQFGVNFSWLKTGEGNALDLNKSTKKSQEKEIAIETILRENLKKTKIIDPDVLTMLFEEIFKLKKKHNLTEKKCASLAAHLYSEITEATDKKELQKSMVIAFINTLDTSALL